jgi:prepilin-type N-terminal cleavage/methylation domain-containing protein
MKKSQAFTLIELSIVLVVIALLVGGILVGRELIHIAQLRSVLSQVEKYNVAVNNYKGKYQCLPGDCAESTLLWGAKADCNMSTPAPSGTETCNGNGDNIVGPDSTVEEHVFWQQLSNAGFISENLRGADFFVGQNPSTGLYDQSIPRTGISGTGIGITNVTGLIVYHTAIRGQYFVMGGFSNVGTHLPYDERLVPADAFYIDSKLDDGMPDTGVVSVAGAFNGGTDRCRNAATPANYEFDDNNNRCAIFIKPSF